MPYEVRAKAGESAFSVVETAKQALAKTDELLELAHVDDVSVRDWAGEQAAAGRVAIGRASRLRAPLHRGTDASCPTSS